MTLLSGAISLVMALLAAWTLRMVAVGIFRNIVAITPRVIVQSLMACISLGVLSGLYPAWRATRLHPVEALRYE